MVRAPSIRGRPAQARKQRNSLLKSTISPARVTKPETAIPKALKRAERRKSLLSKAPHAENENARAFLREGEHSISKSSLRRRKRKARDAIGKNVEQGREGGVKELMKAVDDLEEKIEEDDEMQAKNFSAIVHSGKVTANQRRKYLSQEKARQHAILTDSAYKASPFEALRTHARNAMAMTNR